MKFLLWLLHSMIMIHVFFQVFILMALLSCRDEPKSNVTASTVAQQVKGNIAMDYDSAQWTELTAENGYVIDIRYATTNNFVKTAMYPCARMFLRPEAALALNRVRDRL